MKYMLLIYHDELALTEPAREECYKESTQLAHDLKAKGQYLAVAYRFGKQLITHGPFAESREQLGGYYLVNAKDLDEAINIAARIPMAKKGTVEIRPVIEIKGLPDD